MTYELLKAIRELEAGTEARVSWLRVLWNNRYVLLGLIAAILIAIAWWG